MLFFTLYVKKQHLNKRLYRLRLECASQWDVHWYNIQQMVDHNLHQKMELYNNRLNKKLDQLHQQSRLTQCTKDRTRKSGHHFYHRVENLTNIKFTAEKVKILNYGPQYSIEKPTLSYLPTLVTETIRAIRLLDVKLQDPYRFLAAKKLKQIINRNSISNVHHKRVSYIVKQIRQKLVTGNAILTQADKGRTMVIITQDAYTDKVHTFLTNNNFPTMHKDPTTK